MDAYEHVAKEIDKCYKALTHTKVGVEGTAYLTLDNEDEPWEHG